MFRALVPFSLATAILASLAVVPDQPPQANPAVKGDKEGVEKFLQGYVEAFNKHQSEAAAGFWTPQCVYVDRATGERTAGRAAILADMVKLFKENPGIKIAAEITAVRFVRPDVATIEGRSTSFIPDTDPTTTEFSTLITKEGDRWLIDSVQETSIPTPASPSSALRDLEWLVGDWVDDSPGITVSCSVQWAANRSFLVRSYKVQRDKEEPWEGSQIIGWDARNKQIRSWTFDSDGSFDEGVWSKHGETWSVVLSRTLENGGIATGTQVIKKMGADTYTVQLVAREIDGEPAPSTEVIKVVRVVKKPGETK
jgi:uncharacterized protein (TIGR02246 family)